MHANGVLIISRNNAYVSIPGKLSEINLQAWLFSNPCGKVLIIVVISWSLDLRVQHTVICYWIKQERNKEVKEDNQTKFMTIVLGSDNPKPCISIVGNFSLWLKFNFFDLLSWSGILIAQEIKKNKTLKNVSDSYMTLKSILYFCKASTIQIYDYLSTKYNFKLVIKFPVRHHKKISNLTHVLHTISIVLLLVRTQLMANAIVMVPFVSKTSLANQQL